MAKPGLHVDPEGPLMNIRLAIGAVAALVVLAPAAAGVGAFAGSMSGGGSDSAPTQLADPAE
jgi:hypothetical protein